MMYVEVNGRIQDDGQERQSEAEAKACIESMG